MSSFRVVEEVARHDSAAGWNLNVSTAGESFPAWLPGAERRRSSGHPNSSWAPRSSHLGRAVAAEGGYRVNGRWRFVSGCQQADWFFPRCAR